MRSATHRPSLVTVRFVPADVSAEVPSGTTAAEAAARARVALALPCGGKGACGNCRVRVVSGLAGVSDADRARLPPEAIEDGWRLACALAVEEDITLEHRSGAATGKTGFGAGDVPEPVHTVREVRIPAPSLARQTTDVERLCDAWGAVLTPTIDVLKALGKLPRDAPSARVWGLAEDSELTALADAPPFLGAAIDIGTTTIACALVDLATGCARSAASAWNLQAAFGGDIVSRIRFGMATPDGLDRLSQSARASIEEALRAACAHAGCDPAQVASACVVGNPTMVHLLLGVQPAGLAKAPHVGVTPGGMTLRAHQVGLPILPSAPVFFPPAIASNVGSDITAGLLAARMDARERVTALVDLGTNAEIVLGSSRGLFACSTAAGPAFEGATISRGMRAAPGAIDHVSWSREDGLQTHTIEGAAPQGFCGSGLLDLLAVLLDAGMIDTTGRLRPAAELGPEVPATLRACLVADGASTTFEIAGVKLTAGDVRRLQLAKGAVAAGIAALAARAGVTAAELDEVFLAGAFGSYIKAESARRIGLVPPQAGRIIALGNTAGQGARLALLCAQARRRAAELARTVTYVELAGDAAWRTTFAEAMLFPDR